MSMKILRNVVGDAVASALGEVTSIVCRLIRGDAVARACEKSDLSMRERCDLNVHLQCKAKRVSGGDEYFCPRDAGHEEYAISHHWMLDEALAHRKRSAAG